MERRQLTQLQLEEANLLLDSECFAGEMKSAPGKVEWMKVFYNHQIVFEAQNKALS